MTYSLPQPKDLFPLEVLAELQIALSEIGEIIPCWDSEFDCWKFEHPLYPIAYTGESPTEVCAGYPLWLGELIAERLNHNVSPQTEILIKGSAGKRVGRPAGKVSDNVRMWVPRQATDIVNWIKADPNHLEQVKRLMEA